VEDELISCIDDELESAKQAIWKASRSGCGAALVELSEHKSVLQRHWLAISQQLSQNVVCEEGNFLHNLISDVRYLKF